MNDKQLPPLPTLLHTRVVDGVPCVPVSEHEYRMREYALQAIAHATQPAEVTLPHLWPVISWLKNGCDVSDAITELELYERQIEKSRAILALRPVQVPMTDDLLVNNPTELPKGFIPLQSGNGKLVYAACLDGGRFHGWLMWKHPGGQWVTKRKMEPWEVMQAEDQDHYGIVQESPHYGITAQAKKETP